MDIKLIVSTKDATRDLAKAWYRALVNSLPSGVLTTSQVEDSTACMTTRKQQDKTAFIVPLTRELTANEVEAAIHALDARVDIDFKVEASQTKVELKPEIEVEIDEQPLLELCTSWAKAKHEAWVKEKTDAGWRYGVKASKDEQTHPLLRPWSDLPEEYRKVDTTQVEELLKLLNDNGYVMVKKDELDGMKPKDLAQSDRTKKFYDTLRKSLGQEETK